MSLCSNSNLICGFGMLTTHSSFSKQAKRREHTKRILIDTSTLQWKVSFIDTSVYCKKTHTATRFSALRCCQPHFQANQWLSTKEAVRACAQAPRRQTRVLPPSRRVVTVHKKATTPGDVPGGRLTECGKLPQESGRFYADQGEDDDQEPSGDSE